MKKTGTFQTKHLIQAALLSFTSGLSLTCHAAIMINEIDYDQPGTDAAEFIELFNSGSTNVPLNNFSIELINGRDASSYRSIDLSGFEIKNNGYFVVCSDASLVKNCDYSFTTSNGWLQNGAPDAVALYENSHLLDSLSYEGSMTVFTEGDFMTINDNNSEIVSIARMANGMDSNNNAFDFKLGCITPGTANIAGMGNCSVSNVSAVPVPAAVWLFASGLIGLMGLARRR